MACTEASASTNSAVASRNTTTSPAAANHAARVPIPGKVAAAPTAAPLAVTTDKKRFSSLATILAGLAPGGRDAGGPHTPVLPGPVSANSVR